MACGEFDFKRMLAIAALRDNLDGIAKLLLLEDTEVVVACPDWLPFDRSDNVAKSHLSPITATHADHARLIGRGVSEDSDNR